MIALGLDPGWRSFGYAVVDVDDRDHMKLLRLGVIRTAKAKDKVLVRDDDARCGAELAGELHRLCQALKPDVVCAEALNMMPPRPGMGVPALATSKSGRAWGLVDMLCAVHRRALLQVAPATIKKKTTGNAGASKLEVQTALDELFDGAVGRALAHIKAKKQHEHPVDALGAIVALLDHSGFRLARAAAGPSQRSIDELIA